MKRAFLFLLATSAILFSLPLLPAGASEYIQNGDFSDDLAHYTTGVLDTGSFSGYPKFELPTTAHCLSSQAGNKYLSIHVPGGADAYFEQEATLPASPTSFSFRSWDNLDPITVYVYVITVSDGVAHLLDTYSPPSIEAGSGSTCSSESPVTKSYDLTIYAGMTIKVRLRATSTYNNGTIADFDDLSITDGSTTPTYSGSVVYGLANIATTGTTPCSEGDPVNCATGNLVETTTDLFITGRGRRLEFTRTFNGLEAASATEPGALGYGWTHSYAAFLTTDTAGNATVHQGNGSTVTFIASASGFTAPSFVIATLQQDTSGNYTFTLPNQHSEIFDSTGKLRIQKDRNGYRTKLAYNTSGRLKSVKDPAGRSLTLKYGANGLVSSVTDPMGRRVKYSYDSSNNLVWVKDAGGNVTRFSYDSQHRIIATTDARGGSTSNTYDTSNRVISQTDPGGRTLDFAYANGTNTVTDGNGHVVTRVFADNRLTSLTRGTGTAEASTSKFAYDTAGNLTSVTDPDGNIYSATYDVRGNLLTRRDPLGRTVAFTYDTQNNLLTRTDAMGSTTTFTYDASGNLTSVSSPLGTASKTISFRYRDKKHPGDLTAIIDAEGYKWSLAYNAQGDLVRRVDPKGGIWTGQYNQIGWLTSAVGPRGNASGANPEDFTISRAYSRMGDLISTTNEVKNSRQFAYDRNRNLVKVTDPRSKKLRFVYNANNQIVNVIRPDGGVWTNTFDAAGNLTGQTDGLGATTSYVFDALNRRIRITDPLGRVTKLSYAPSGNLLTLENAGGNTTTFSYDAAKQLTGISYSDGKTPAVSFTYNANGKRTAMTDGTGTTSYQWDTLGRLTGSTNGAGRQVLYGYDLRGAVTSITYPSGKQVTRVFDRAGRMASVSDWLGYTTKFEYDIAGNLARIAYGNGAKALFTHDNADRVAGIAYSRGQSSFLELEYSRNAVGMLSSETNSGAASIFTYTPTNQLRKVNKNKFAFDRADNLVNLGGSELVYDEANELVSMTGGQGPLSFQYDTNGNRVQVSGSALTATYTYDQENRLTAIGTDATYAYNGKGLRMSKTVGGTQRLFTWDLAHKLPLLLTDADTQFIYGPKGRPLEQIGADGSVLWLHQDQLGSTRAITNLSGKNIASYSYSAFGEILSASGAEPVTPLLFAGQYTDSESGFQYLRARYHDPATGQFLTRDPMASITRQPYLYANGDPVNRSDPSGKDTVIVVVSPGTYTIGTGQSEQNQTDTLGYILSNGVGQTGNVGIADSSNAQACALEQALSDSGELAPGTHNDFNAYAGNSVSYNVTQNVHVSGDASNPNSVAIVTSQVTDTQGNVVYQDQVTGTVVGQNTTALQEQGGANVNAFLQGVTNTTDQGTATLSNY